MFSFSGKRIGIDLGTANTLVYLVGEGIVLNEPTVVAVTAEDNRVVAVGREAKEMLGRTPGNIVALRPLRDGVIADYTITEAMLSYFIDKAAGKSRFFKPEVMVCIPSGVTQVERRAVLDATMSAGAKVAYLIEEPLAAAIGAKIPIAQAAGVQDFPGDSHWHVPRTAPGGRHPWGGEHADGCSRNLHQPVAGRRAIRGPAGPAFGHAAGPP
jgi:rod shape-determining protein MreB